MKELMKRLEGEWSKEQSKESPDAPTGFFFKDHSDFYNHLQSFIDNCIQYGCKNIWTLHHCQQSGQTWCYGRTRTIVSLESSNLDLECHIVYSQTYRVPVLYFRLSHLNGRPCMDPPASLVQEWHAGSPSLAVAYGLEEHPLLGELYWCIHPCMTNQLFKELAMYSNSANCLVASWLSIYGRALGLDIPMVLLQRAQ